MSLRKSRPSPYNRPRYGDYKYIRAAVERWMWTAVCTVRGTVDPSELSRLILPLVFFRRVKPALFLEPNTSKIGDGSRFAELIGELRRVAACDRRLRGIFDGWGYAIHRNGNAVIDGTRLSRLVEVIWRRQPKTIEHSADVLTLCHEFFIRKFSVGESIEEHCTPPAIAELIARLLRPSSTCEVYDPSCGAGWLLLHVARWCVRQNRVTKRRCVRVYGQELNPTTASLARMNVFLDGVAGHVVVGDTLTQPHLLTRGKLRQFDYVVANPMWNQRVDDSSAFISDPFSRFRFGAPPTRSADWAWAQHVLASLKPRGRGAIVLNLGALSRGSGTKGNRNDRSIRQRFVEADLIEAVIQLPENLFYNTVAPAALVLINRNKRATHRGKILFVDASLHYVRQKSTHILGSKDVARIANAFNGWRNIKGFARLVSIADVRQTGYNLIAATYAANPHTSGLVQRLTPERSLAARVARVNADRHLDRIIRPCISNPEKLFGSLNHWRRVRLGDVAQLLNGGTPNRNRLDWWAGCIPWASPRDIKTPLLSETRQHISAEALKEGSCLAPIGTVLVVIRGMILTRDIPMALTSRPIAFSQDLKAIAPNDQLDVHYLLFALQAHKDELFRDIRVAAHGTRYISTATLSKLAIHLPPLADQRSIAKVAGAIRDAAAARSDELLEFSAWLRTRVRA